MQSTGLIHLEIQLFDKKDNCKQSGCEMSVCLNWHLTLHDIKNLTNYIKKIEKYYIARRVFNISKG
jgi:hypothetical protein